MEKNNSKLQACAYVDVIILGLNKSKRKKIYKSNWEKVKVCVFSDYSLPVFAVWIECGCASCVLNPTHNTAWLRLLCECESIYFHALLEQEWKIIIITTPHISLETNRWTDQQTKRVVCRLQKGLFWCTYISLTNVRIVSVFCMSVEKKYTCDPIGIYEILWELSDFLSLFGRIKWQIWILIDGICIVRNIYGLLKLIVQDNCMFHPFVLFHPQPLKCFGHYCAPWFVVFLLHIVNIH